MTVNDICYLVREDPEAHGVLEEPKETLRMVYCDKRSVTMTETYKAMDHHLSPAAVFVLADPLEYQGEKILIHNGTRYQVVRTYTTINREVEIVVGEAGIDA